MDGVATSGIRSMDDTKEKSDVDAVAGRVVSKYTAVNNTATKILHVNRLSSTIYFL